MIKSKKTVAIYARVSTDKQTTDSQLNELRDFVKRSGWMIQNEYIDHAYTGANTKRPAFSEMMKQARKRKFNTLLVWKLDRLSRSLKDLVNTLDELGTLNIDFISYDNDLNTSTPSGKLVFNVMGAVAEFERDIISERIKAGLKNARVKGQNLGRPRVSPSLIPKVKELKAQGLSIRQIEKTLKSKNLKISYGSIKNILKRQK